MFFKGGDVFFFITEFMYFFQRYLRLYAIQKLIVIDKIYNIYNQCREKLQILQYTLL